jgi:hypothetical protein
MQANPAPTEALAASIQSASIAFLAMLQFKPLILLN